MDVVCAGATHNGCGVAETGSTRGPGARLSPVVLHRRLREGTCARRALREFTANFEVQPSPDGQGIVWTLQFRSRAEYHKFLDTTADGAERAKVREMIAAGLQLHHLPGCSAQEKAVKRLGNDGIAFIGSCESNHAHATLAGGI